VASALQKRLWLVGRLTCRHDKQTDISQQLLLQLLQLHLLLAVAISVPKPCRLVRWLWVSHL
jgi:hypothetical protein